MAQQDLGLSIAEARGLSLRQFTALHKRFGENRRHADFVSGTVAASVYNAMCGKREDGEMWRADHIFPWLPKPEKHVQDGEAMLDAVLQSLPKEERERIREQRRRDLACQEHQQQ